MMRTDQINLLAPGLHVEPAVKAAMRRVAAASLLSREQICDRMNELAESAGIKLNGNAKRLELATLEKWLNPHELSYVPTLRALVTFCRVTRSLEPLSALAAPCEGQVIDADQARLLRIAEIEAEERKLKREKKRLQSGL